MKSLLTTIALTFFWTLAAFGQIADIPDNNFRNALSGLGLDPDGDGQYLITDLEQLDSLNLYALDISDMSGIEYFVNLKMLNVQYNNITDIDLSQNILLESLNLGGNEITSIDLSANTSLTELNCGRCLLVNLDLSSNTELQKLYCEVNQNLSNIMFPENAKLEEINCYSCALENIQLEKCTELRILDCAHNKITQLDVSNNPFLEKLTCTNNLITEIDLSYNPELSLFYCINNQLSHLDLSRNSKMSHLGLENNLFTSINLSDTPNLFFFGCQGNDLESLDLSNQKSLARLFFDNNENLSCLDVSDSPNIEWLGAQNTSVSFACVHPDAASKFENHQSFNSTSIYTSCNFNFYCNSLVELSGNVNYTTDDCTASTNYPFPNVRFRFETVLDSFDIFTLTEADFKIKVVPQNVKITPIIENAMLFEIDPPFYNLVVRQDIVDLDFCISSIAPEKVDLSIDAFTYDRPRPGFEHTYQISIQNPGNIPSSGVVKFDFDSSTMSYNGSNQNWILEDDNTLTTTYSQLFPFEQRWLTASFTLNSPMDTPPLVSGDILNVCAKIIPSENDCDRLNNISTLSETVVNSYDPNDKINLNGRYVLQDSSDNSLKYRIRFENTGTAVATHVAITDTLDDKALDHSSLKLIDASHDLQLEVNDNVAHFIFRDINLPYEDDQNDGYVIFKIDPIANLTTPLPIHNLADIYFDFNFPIRTNTDTSYLVVDMDDDGFNNLDDCDDENPDVNPGALEIDSNGIDDDCDGVSSLQELENEDLKLFPNPTDDVLTIKSDSKILSMQLLSTSGKLLKNSSAINSSLLNLDLSSLKEGKIGFKPNGDS